MFEPSHSRLRVKVNSLLWTVFLLLVVMGVARLAHHFRFEKDFTAQASNTLSPASLALLRQIQDPVHVTAFALSKDAGGNNIHQLIKDKMRAWQRIKPNLTLSLIDPREQPQKADAATLHSVNELQIHLGKRTEHLALNEFNEINFIHVLIRLSGTSHRTVYWLMGHGERQFNGKANHDLGEFGHQLALKGFNVSALNLAIAQDVPNDAATLVIAGPQVALQDSEVTKVLHYVRNGGHLLWLVDPGPVHGLDPIAQYLGLVLTPGTVVDLSTRPRQGPPIFALGSYYAQHPATASLPLNTLFPQSRQIARIDRNDWRATPLIEVAQRGWVETGPLEDNPLFEKNHDLPGPINIATAFERRTGNQSQRVIIIGGGSFLSNAFLGNGGNLTLGLALLNWLSGEDHVIALVPHSAADSHIDIDQNTLSALAIGFLVIMPILLGLTGFIVWWRRKKSPRTIAPDSLS